VNVSARSTGDPGIFYQKIIEIFITVNGQGHFLPEGPGGGKGEPGVPPRMSGFPARNSPADNNNNLYIIFYL
jgi:hypothetical protein